MHSSVGLTVTELSNRVTSVDMSHMMECVLACVCFIYCVTYLCLFVLTVLGQCYLHQSKYVAIVLLEECLALQQKYPSANAVKVANSKCCV